MHLTAGAVGAPMVRNMETHMASLLASDASYWSPMQFSNLDNPAAHVSVQRRYIDLIILREVFESAS